MNVPVFSPFCNKGQNGFSLIEVFIALCILSSGLLGLAAMQLQAKQRHLDALQRASAVLLAQDLLERMYSNPHAATLYVLDAVDASQRPAIEPQPDCRHTICSSTQLARHDLWEWQSLLHGINALEPSQAAQGGLRHAIACVHVLDGWVQINLAWRGMQRIHTQNTEPCGIGSGHFGEHDELRQTLVIRSFIADSRAASL